MRAFFYQNTNKWHLTGVNKFVYINECLWLAKNSPCAVCYQNTYNYNLTGVNNLVYRKKCLWLAKNKACAVSYQDTSKYMLIKIHKNSKIKVVQFNNILLKCFKTIKSYVSHFCLDLFYLIF